ncbi:unnamed protein product [Adineta steineri]|uniref:gamma-glutamylcyclotransferase n=1 Tax=Adineta steineri TaxID=433720 RepID=A0A819G6H5_9BILA|nr:unnamed protein product [Adineta steineri]CAF3877032.1 unnamed protein product [Adineta steineri]
MDTFNYFGYASNLKESLLEERIGDDHPIGVNIGRLNDYHFRFNHKQIDGYGRANIVPMKGSCVNGLVYVINEKHKDYLLKTEPGYKIIEVNIELDCDHSIIQAITFIDETNIQQDFLPSNEYLQTIINGAKDHHFSKEYIDYIISIANNK